MIFGLFVTGSVMGSIAAVETEFVFFLSGYVSILEVAVVFLLQWRWCCHNSRHNGTQNKNLSHIVNNLHLKDNGIQISFERIEENLNSDYIAQTLY